MLIKEYRIPLPLTVEEYRIAQLYMICVSTEYCWVFFIIHPLNKGGGDCCVVADKEALSSL